MSNILTLDEKSRQLFRKTIYDTYMNKTSNIISITFVRQTSKLYSIIHTQNILSNVLIIIVLDYLNDINMVFDITLFNHDTCQCKFDTVGLEIKQRNANDFDIDFSIFSYPMHVALCPKHTEQLSEKYPCQLVYDIHSFERNNKSNVFGTDSFIGFALNTYMQKYYGKSSYIKQIVRHGCSLSYENFEKRDHKKIKYVIVICKVLIKNFHAALMKLNYDLVHQKN